MKVAAKRPHRRAGFTTGKWSESGIWQVNRLLRFRAIARLQPTAVKPAMGVVGRLRPVNSRFRGNGGQPTDRCGGVAPKMRGTEAVVPAVARSRPAEHWPAVSVDRRRFALMTEWAAASRENKREDAAEPALTQQRHFNGDGTGEAPAPQECSLRDGTTAIIASTQPYSADVLETSPPTALHRVSTPSRHRSLINCLPVCSLESKIPRAIRAVTARRVYLGPQVRLRPGENAPSWISPHPKRGAPESYD